MTAVLVKAIQEQQVLIEALQTKVAALEGGVVKVAINNNMVRQ